MDGRLGCENFYLGKMLANPSFAVKQEVGKL